MTFSTTWKPPVTHLIDDDDTEGRTLCGIAPTREWEVAMSAQTDENIEDGIACGCRRCAAISKKRLAQEPKP